MNKIQNKPFTTVLRPLYFIPTTVLPSDQDAEKTSASYLPDSATMTLTESEENGRLNQEENERFRKAGQPHHARRSKDSFSNSFLSHWKWVRSLHASDLQNSTSHKRRDDFKDQGLDCTFIDHRHI